MRDDPRPRVGVSACLLGRPVRFDGGHKLDAFVRDELGRHVELVPVCPELEAGLGVPRPAVRLVQLGGDRVRMIDPRSGADHTDLMLELARRRVEELAREELCGFVVQKGSPSCGLERVKVHGAAGTAPRRDGRGLFTAALIARLPLLPVEEEGRLHDPGLRESFVTRVFAAHRLSALFGRPWTMAELVAFHASEKMLVLLHDRTAYEQLGRRVATAAGRPRDEVAAEVQRVMLTALARIPSRGHHVNVLQHLAGYFKRSLDGADRAELQGVIAGYGRDALPLIVPVTLLRHHVRRLGVDYLARQTYLDPHPRALGLRNHV